MTHLWPSLCLSLQIATGATVLAALVGIPLAYWLARSRLPGLAIIEALCTVPLVLPPTVVGYLLIAALGVQSPVGGWLRNHLNFRFIFSQSGAILAAAVVGLPLLLIPARAAFASVGREMEDVARLMGAGPFAVFFHVNLPLARKGIAGGLLLAFARALGEFGATVMVFGNFADRQTLPIAIWADYEAGDMNSAVPAVLLLISISLFVIAIYNGSGLSRREP